MKMLPARYFLAFFNADILQKNPIISKTNFAKDNLLSLADGVFQLNGTPLNEIDINSAAQAEFDDTDLLLLKEGEEIIIIGDDEYYEDYILALKEREDEEERRNPSAFC